MWLFSRPPTAHTTLPRRPVDLPLFDETGKVTPGCEWVAAREGIPTPVWSGIPMLLDHCGHWQQRLDDGTWVRITDADSGMLAQARAAAPPEIWPVGRYWLCGPGLFSNPHDLTAPTLIPDGWAPLDDTLDVAGAPRGDDMSLWRWLHQRTTRSWPYQGVAWNRGNGDRATVLRDDFPEGKPPDPDEVWFVPADCK